MTQPGTFGNQIPAGDDFLVRELADIKRQLREMRAARSLQSSTIGEGGIDVNGGGITLTNGALTVDGGAVNVTNGDLTVTGTGVAKSGNFDPGNTGWSMNPDGNVEFNDITLRGGIIGNDALTSPVQVEIAKASLFLPNAPLDYNTFLTSPFTVPDGFSQAAIVANVSYSTNVLDGVVSVYYDILAGTEVINTPQFPSGVLDASSGPVAEYFKSLPGAALLTGLVGGSTLTIGVRSRILREGGTPTPSVTTGAQLVAQVTWLR